MDISVRESGNVMKIKLLPLSLFFILVFSNLFLLAQSHNENLSFDVISYKIDEYGQNNILKANVFLDSLYHDASLSTDSLRLKARCLYWQTGINANQRRYDSSMIQKISDMDSLLSKKQAPFEKALLKYALSLSYFDKSDYAQSFSTALQALDMFKRLDNNALTSKALQQIGNIGFFTKSYDMAEDFYKQALALATESKQQMRLRLNIYAIWVSTGRIEAAIDSLSTDLHVIADKSDTATLIRTLSILGAYYDEYGDYQKADECYQKGFALLPTVKNNSLAYSLYQNRGVYYMLTKQWENALLYFNKSKEMASINNNTELLSLPYICLAKVFEETGQVDSAFFYLSLYIEVSSQPEKLKAIELYRAYIIESLSSTQKELTIAQQEIELKSKQFIITVGSFTSIILLVGLGLIVIQQKKRIRDVENKKLEEALRKNIQIEKLQEEHIEAQVRELTSNSLMISNKNHILQQIADLVKQLPISPKDARDINQVINSNMNTDEAWDAFMLHFEQVRPEFFNKLKTLNKDLSNTDLQFFAYLRIGMTSKQIAQIMNISYGSTRNYRSRMKKKLNMEDDEKLDALIMSL